MRLAEGRHRVFITVMTYPAPSGKDQETVCTAGIGEDGRWIRLYPVDYRYLDDQHRYRKWQWISADLGPASGGDQRRESHKVTDGSIELGDLLNSTTDKKWEQRRKIIDPLETHTYYQLQQRWTEDQAAKQPRRSLGIIRPTQILDVVPQRRKDPDWSSTDIQKMSQLRIFGPQPKSLQKVPYHFRVKFRCADSDEDHLLAMEDWETGRLYWNCVWGGDSEEVAIQKVRSKYMDLFFDLAKRDVRLFMGTIAAFNTWVVIGSFYPPRREHEGQTSLF